MLLIVVLRATWNECSSLRVLQMSLGTVSAVYFGVWAPSIMASGLLGIVGPYFGWTGFVGFRVARVVRL